MKKLTSAPPTTSKEKDTSDIVTPMKSIRLKPISKTYHMGTQATGVRDAIVRLLERDYSHESFMPDLATHLKKIGVDKLDIYSEIELRLPNHSVCLIFQTWRQEPDEMTYTLPDLSMDPDERLRGEGGRRRGGFFSWLS